MKFVYVLDATEHERGWGMRPDGHVLFRNKEEAQEWMKKQYDGRSIHSVPDDYNTYGNGRWEPVHESLFNAVNKSGRRWVRDLNEVVPATTTMTINLLWTIEVSSEEEDLTDREIFEKYFPSKGKIGVADEG